ncbi:MAG TPA: endolytic transglycosylase MltG, partial [Thermoanaerobaculia bacterium]|nr:endolytic transglycosylase MltG [Thermoanaerobaculia bacterium]
PSGLDAGQILDRLAARGVIAHPFLARLYLTYGLGAPSLKAGEYEFSGKLSPVEVLDKLMRGTVVLHRVTLAEGLTLDETASHLASAGFGEKSEFLKVMDDPGPISDLDPEARNLEGYLFPETYSFAKGTPEREIVRRMVDTFRKRFASAIRPQMSTGDSVHRIVVLASIVEKEAKLDGERPLIAAVYRNRLDRHMALYADPTVIYGLELLGRYDGNLRRDDLRFDTPYNTYLHPGLPPGPICSPGLASLRAAVNPADVPYLYFVSRNDGSHVFSRTLAEHNRNVEKWQKEYWRRRWESHRRRNR